MEVQLRLPAIDGGTGQSTYEGKQAHKQALEVEQALIREYKKANGWFYGLWKKENHVFMPLGAKPNRFYMPLGAVHEAVNEAVHRVCSYAVRCFTQVQL